MSCEIAASSFAPCHQHRMPAVGKLDGENWILKKKQEWWQMQCHATTSLSARQRTPPLRIKNQMAVKPSTYSSRIFTDIPLYESPGASFDQYLEDRPRVFKAMFPGKQRSRRLNEEEWRIQMLPIQFGFLTVRPVVDMRLRCKTGGKDYPPEVPRDITKVLELDITRWELRGLVHVIEPSNFSLGVKGALYSDRRGTRSRLKGGLEMNISFVLPPVLALIPEDVRRNIAESIKISPLRLLSIENSIAMSKITATSFAPCQNTVLFGQFNIGNWSHNRENWNHVKLKKKKKKKQQLQYLATKSEKRSRPLVVEDQTEPDYYCSRTFADIPLYESPWALFDHYLEDKSRVFKAMFPDEQRSKRLNEVLRRLEKEMEDKVNGRLLADYGKFKKERFIHSWIWRISKLWNGKRR